jgi:hypothetical protein
MRIPDADGGGRCAQAWPEVTLLVGPWVCEAVDLVQVPAVFPCPRGGLKDFELLPSCQVMPLGLR